MKICLDAGHGGKDSGATGGGIFEKNVALQIVNKLNTAFKAQGFETVLTRSNDEYISLSERCNIANNAKADLFISIHLNSNGGKPATGIETLVYSDSGETGKIAHAVQTAMINITQATDRGVKVRQNLAVLRGTTMKAMLIETGFINNDNDRNKLTKEYYQNSLVNAILSAVCNYYGVEIKNATNGKINTTAGVFADVPTTDTAYEEIKKLKDYGIVKGYGDGTFKPDANITRREISIMIARALTVCGK